MAKLVWDETGEKRFELGVDHGVLFLQRRDGDYDPGVPWNGLTGVTEASDGGDGNSLWADNLKYGRRRSKETFRATVEAYTYPDEFEECDGSRAVTTGILVSQQERKRFGFTWRTLLGNDRSGPEAAYKIHIVWNARANPSEKAYDTVNESTDAVNFNWEILADGVSVQGYQNTASITVESDKVDPVRLADLENMLYGTASTVPRLPSPEQVLTLFKMTVEDLLDSDDATVLDSRDNIIQARVRLF